MLEPTIETNSLVDALKEVKANQGPAWQPTGLFPVHRADIQMAPDHRNI